MKANLSNYRQSPRKVRLVTDLIKGKKVEDALIELSFLPKRAALPVEKLLRSAIANAGVKGKDAANLVISNVTVDEGAVLKRIMPRARGSASRINKRTSHIAITLREVESKRNSPAGEKKAVTKKVKADKK